MLDESILDDSEALTRADTGRLLLGLASAGARVRGAARQADEAGIAQLRPDGRPRNILVAGHGSAIHAGQLLGALGSTACPVLLQRPTGAGAGVPAAQSLVWLLPGWAGPLDLLLIPSPTGTEPGLTSLVEQAYPRGCTVVVVAPEKSPLAEAARQARGLALPYVRSPQDSGPAEFGTAAALATEPYAAGAVPDEDPGALWALLIPLLALADRIGIAAAPPDAVQAAADRLDEMAARCGPANATYQNPAKSLAAELADALPLLWSEGPYPTAVAKRFADCLAQRAGRPALHAALPEALAVHGGLLAGAFSSNGDSDDFFRDRVEVPQSLRLRVVLLREQVVAAATSPAAAAAQELARTHGTPLSEVSPSAAGQLDGLAELIALTDFASAYLALGEGP